MDDHRLPKICLLRQMELFRADRYVLKYSWVAQLDVMLRRIDRGDLWLSADPSAWASLRALMTAEYATCLRLDDMARMASSTSLQNRMQLSHTGDLPAYLAARGPIRFVRAAVQLRLATNRPFRLSAAGIHQVIDPALSCPTCNLNEPETIAHIFLNCPLYKSLRSYYLRHASDVLLEQILSPSNNQDIKVKLPVLSRRSPPTRVLHDRLTSGIQVKARPFIQE